MRVLGSETLRAALQSARNKLGDRGRVVVRASGTEQVIRVFAETQSESLSKETAFELAKVVSQAEK